MILCACGCGGEVPLKRRTKDSQSRYLRGHSNWLRTYVEERHEQWVGLAYVEQHGLPGYPPRSTPVRDVRAVLERVLEPDAFQVGDIA